MRARHVDEAAAAREVLDPADCRLARLILLFRRDGVVPDGAVGELELQIVADMEARPVRARAAHLHLHGAVGEALPVRAVLHKEVDGAELPGRHAVAARIGIVSDPVRICRRETDGDAPLRAHAAVRDDVALDDGAVLAGTIGETVCALCDVKVDRAIVVRDKLAVGADRRPCTIDRPYRAAADVDGRGDGADRFVCALSVCRIISVRKHIDKTVDGDVRLDTRHAVHRLDDGDVRLIVAICTHLEHLVLKVIAAVGDMDRTAAVDEERRRLSIVRALRVDGDGAGVLDVYLRALTDGGDARRADIRLRLDGEVLSVQIDIERLSRIGA